MAHSINFDEPPEQWIEIPKEWSDRTFDLVPALLPSWGVLLGQCTVSDFSQKVSRPSDSHAELDADKE